MVGEGVMVEVESRRGRGGRDDLAKYGSKGLLGEEGTSVGDTS